MTGDRTLLWQPEDGALPRGARERAEKVSAVNLSEDAWGRTRAGGGKGRGDGRNRLRMVASHPSTSANPVERQNARRRHPLNNEALGFYACLTSPHECSFLRCHRRERNSRNL